MQNHKKLVLFLIFVIPLILVFKNLLFSESLAWGDSPFFEKSIFSEIISEPKAWDYRSVNFGGVNLFLWLAPVMLVYAVIGNILGNDNALRLVFYLPSFIASIAGIYLLTKKFNYSITGFVFTLLVYLLNTYFILLVDGGQVGVVLAYGFFSLSIWASLNYLQNTSLKNFILALTAGLWLILTDVRIFVIQLIAVGLIHLLTTSKHKLKYSLKAVIILLICITAINLYWLIPLLTIQITSLSLDISQLQLLTILNGLLLYQPHWPNNIYGEIAYPSALYMLFPLATLLSLLTKKVLKQNAIFLIAFLIFVFLLKGEAPPLGQIYNFILTLPFGSVLRDSSKFFIPAILFSSLLIGSFIETQKSKASVVLVYVGLLLTIAPALIGNMNFVLGQKNADHVYKINETIAKNDNFSRTAWFPEKHPQSISSQQNQALTAKDLANLRIFANMNVGSSDRFNFMNNISYQDWFRLLGIKYLSLSGNPRVNQLSKEEQKDWDNLISLLSKQDNLVNSTEGLYELQDVKPRFLASDTAVLIIGSDKIAAPTVPMIFAEDSKTEVKNLQQLNPKALNIYYYKTTFDDLQLSILKEQFIPISDIKKAEWSVWKSEDFLKAKYELLIRGLDYNELDFGKGFAFSTQKNEVIGHTFSNLIPGKYYFAARGISRDGQTEITLNGVKHTSNFQNENYSWFVVPVTADEDLKITISNQADLAILNTITLISEKDWFSAKTLAESIQTTFTVLTDSDFQSLIAKDHFEPATITTETSFKYVIEGRANTNWIFMSDSYHPLWKLRRGEDNNQSFPAYSEFNLFYSPFEWANTKIEFTGQYQLRWGIYYSIIALLTIIAAILFKVSKNERKN